jgi:hypothetical protein
MTPPGEPHTMLSPVEKAVLASCEQWRTLKELQADLAVEFHFDRIPPTIAFLRRRLLIDAYAGGLSHPAQFKQTRIGELVLAAQRRNEAAFDFSPERRLHLATATRS